jgi:hypothetical protein
MSSMRERGTAKMKAKARDRVETRHLPASLPVDKLFCYIFIKRHIFQKNSAVIYQHSNQFHMDSHVESDPSKPNKLLGD